ncbi:hypothetical protein TSUD_70110 [Trifolium subterraneum]|uniref:Trichome birefringence-like C-terminal domain-containing protein n=1 Tax=Trifolium subterraneum TaxID=3900 RepID=A0A2Z6MRX3_TRISU|nr:hypothetical protein TSUD_70110 [Trifolium subterraneum]
MSRTQWESLICMLMTGVEDKMSVYEVNQNQITKRIRFLGVRFSAFNFTIEFFRSVFLVQQGQAPEHAPKRVKSTLLLDKLDDISHQWVNSDILIFNTGHCLDRKDMDIDVHATAMHPPSTISMIAMRGRLFPGWKLSEAWDVNSFCL